MGDHSEGEGDSAFDDEEDDPEFEKILHSNRIPSTSRYLPQRTLDGLLSSDTSSSVAPREPKRVPLNIPTHHRIDRHELSKYIYPTNFEVRDYQYNVVRRAFYDNLLVALPTGLGKTFIASTVMLNFFRWFPDSKIVFMAPTKPLVAQQIKACCSITGLPTSEVAILLDKTRRNRGEIWDSKRVFFTTPQVVENDLVSGTVDPKSIALLVIDEAHRSKGNYAYNNVVKFLKRFNNSFRILALTATPASDVEGVQEIIDNLSISKVEVRTEGSIDIIKYMKRKRMDKRTIGQSPEIIECIDLLSTAIEPVLKLANERKIYDMRDPSKINFFHCMDASRRMMANKSIPEGLRWSNHFVLQLLGVVGMCLKRLNIYGLRSFYNYFNEKCLEFASKKKSKNKLAGNFYFSEAVQTLLHRSKSFVDDPKCFSHPKIEALMEVLHEFFEAGAHPKDSKVIVFTEFRDSALEIVQSIERSDSELKPHIFIGQAKERDKFDEENPKKKGPSKKNDSDSTSRTSSEDAQIKGMNQKLQKEIIKKFKSGSFNILVATSIGEEGLDIGEVDLIICYDSTSSPIKNVQRMGRTGRKRDGTVVLLFSGNEESKFDKAMGGYEYIQQHIMKGNLITLADRNRIIPAEFEPQVEEKFIEVPDENQEIDAVEDEDEIIRIATQYMLGGKGKKTSKVRKEITKKQAKRFFMPDNVETGFKKVTDMLRNPDPKIQAVVDRPKDIIDSFLDSESELDSDDKLTNKRNVTAKMSIKNNSVPVINDSNGLSAGGHFTPAPKTSNPPAVQKRPIENSKPKTKGTLGIKRPRPNSIIEQLKKSQSNSSNSNTIIVDDIDLPQYTVEAQTINEPFQNDPKSNEAADEDDDYFDDGLDEELAMISPDVEESTVPESSTQEKEPIFKNKFETNEGLLNDNESMELYTSYFTNIDPLQRTSRYNPSQGIHRDDNHNISTVVGNIGHSKKTRVLLNASSVSHQSDVMKNHSGYLTEQTLEGIVDV